MLVDGTQVILKTFQVYFMSVLPLLILMLVDGTQVM